MKDKVTQTSCLISHADLKSANTAQAVSLSYEESCDHLNVRIEAIDRAFSRRTRSRLIRGSCQQCHGIVRRTMTAQELSTGKQTTHWSYPCPTQK